MFLAILRLKRFNRVLECELFKLSFSETVITIRAMNFSEELSNFEPDSKEYKFFEKVFEKVGKKFIRKSVEQDVKEAQNKLNKAMQKYFEMHILANAIMKAAEQDEMSQRICPGSCNYSELSSNNINSFYLNLVKKYLPPDEASDELKLFGLSQKDVLQASQNQQKSEFEYTNFKKLVEDNINNFCMKLIKYTGGTVVHGRNWKNAFDKTMKDLESNATYLSNEDAKEQSKKQLRDMIKAYYEELTKGVSLLSKLLSLYELKLEFESDTAEFYRQRCYAVYLKIRIFELKILEATYNQETIPALKKISSQLDLTEKELQEEQNEKTVALESYLKLGEEYESFVDEYTHLTKSIREQKWAIEELKSRKLQYERNS